MDCELPGIIPKQCHVSDGHVNSITALWLGVEDSADVIVAPAQKIVLMPISHISTNQSNDEP